MSISTHALDDLGDEGLSIVIPAYNEERGVGPVLEELLTTLSELELGIDVEVLIVNDGSSDGTAEAIAPFVGDTLTLINHSHNRGYGASLKSGIHRARHPWILITDADGTYPNSFIPHLLERRAANDMVVGARRGEEAHIPLIRRPPKWALRKLSSYLSQRDIPDLNSGFRLMRKEVVDEYLHILPNGFSFTTTITLAMLSAGYDVEYVNINYLRREGRSKIRPIADTLNFLKLIIRTIMYFDPLRVFLPIAATFLLASILVAAISISLGRFLDVTTVLLFVTSVQLLATGMLADTFNRHISRR